MHKALIGYTGFVGGNIARQSDFTDHFNSANIDSIRGRKFDLVVSAGTYAAKWQIDKEPEKDWASISKLMENLKTIDAKKFVLISTVDVYPSPIEADEDSIIDSSALAPYGKHRLLLEQFVRQNFDAHIVRLPGLFGSGLKKNVIFDFLNNNCLDRVHQDGIFQFYYLENIWRDIEKVLEHGIPLINFATEPISIKEIARSVFGIDFKNNLPPPAPHYDFRTRFGSLWDQNKPYLYLKEDIVRDMNVFVSKYKSQ